MTVPTPRDVSNARTRQAIADRQNAEYEEAQRLAQEALGSGYRPWMKLTLTDDSGRVLAKAFKVYRGEKKLSEFAMFVRRLPDGTVLVVDSAAHLFPDCTRNSFIYWSAVEVYQPRSAEQLAEARGKRQRKAVEKETQAHPLFAEQIRKEEA